MGLVRRIFSGKVVSRSSGSVSGKKKLLQFFFAGFCFSERWLFFRFLQPIPIMSNQDLLGEGGYVGCGSSISGVRRKQMGEMVSISACSVETIGGFVFAGDVFSVPVAVV
ncbi:hypothetical protein Bca101_100192 [Brassica carinata]